MMYAAPDAVTPAEGVVQRIGDRRENARRQRPFPELPDAEEEPASDDPASSVPRERTPARDAEDSPRIDIHVRGRFLPTRQLFPPAQRAPTLH